MLYFKDFQLATTIEEFVHIFGFRLKNRKPYLYFGAYPKLLEVAKVLKVKNNYKFELKTKGSTFGFEKKFFEEKTHDLAEEKDWDTFMDVLTLIINETILFPCANDFISLAAIDVFLAYKHKKVNPTYAILADVYYTVNFYYEKNKGRILCCLSALCVWLVIHVFRHKFKTRCPIQDYKMCNMEITTKEWAKHLVNLDEEKVCWNPKWRDIDQILYRWGHFLLYNLWVLLV
jgi:hypothetical protein